MGEPRSVTFFSPFAEPLAGVKESRFSYEAKEYDPLTQDYNFNFRMYSPHGPPIMNQPDTLIQNVYDPQSLNRYSFERNNPYGYTDPTGHYWNVVLRVLFAVYVRTFEYQPEAAAYMGETVLVETGSRYINAAMQEQEPFTLEQGTYVPSYAKEEQQRLCRASGGSCSALKQESLRPLQDTKTTITSPSSQTTRQQTTNSNLNNQVQQSNLAGNPSPISSSSGAGSGGGYDSAARGYRTSDGRFYPTNNKDWKPNPNAPRYVPPPLKPKSKPKPKT